jgi:hypothetical protein
MWFLSARASAWCRVCPESYVACCPWVHTSLYASSLLDCFPSAAMASRVGHRQPCSLCPNCFKARKGSCTHIVTNTVCPLPCCSYGMKGWALEFAHDFDKSTAGPVVGLSKRLGSSGATVAATCDTGKHSVVPGMGGAPGVDCWANLIGAL